MKTTKTAKNIQAINRRAATLAKLFGIESKEYQEFTARMAGTVGAPDIYVNSKGIVQIRNTKSARANYRQISALSKRVKQTLTSVLKRKAEKQKEAFEEMYEESNYEEYDGFVDYETYRRWYQQFDSYYDSCYTLATMLVPDNDVQWYAAMLFENDEAYRDNWNYAYNAGMFDEFKDASKDYENDDIKDAYVVDPYSGDIYGIDPETGEIIDNPDFFE